MTNPYQSGNIHQPNPKRDILRMFSLVTLSTLVALSFLFTISLFHIYLWVSQRFGPDSRPYVVFFVGASPLAVSILLVAALIFGKMSFSNFAFLAIASEATFLLYLGVLHFAFGSLYNTPSDLSVIRANTTTTQ